MAENVINKLNIEAKGDTKQAEQSLDRLGSALQTVQAMMKSFNTDKFGEQLTQATADANNLAQTFKSLTPKQAEQGFNNAIKKATELGRSLRNMSEDDKGYGKKVGDFAYQMVLAENYLQAFRGSSEGAVDSIGRIGDKAEESGGKSLTFGERFTSACSSISEFAGKVDSGMSKVGKTVGFMGKKFVNAISPMRLFNREQMKTTWASSLLGRAFARVTRMFRIMITRMLIRGFISNVREGFQNIAKYSDEVNQAFSRIGQSAHTLYNSVATAFAPLIQAIAPYIVRALDLITSAFSKVAELISALTGKSFYIKATKYNYDYAKSLDKSTNATNKNSRATAKNTKKKKENKDATIGIDRLNVISPEKNKGTNGNGGNGNGAGSGGVSANDMFDTKPVSKKMKNLAKEIKKIAKKLFNPIKEAWNKVGSRVISSWKNALKDVWETIKTIGRDFLTMWSQPQTEKIFENIFGVFADLGDTVKNLSSQFRKAWNYNNTGLHIFENIRDVVGIVVQHIRNCSKYTKEWAKKLNFVPLLSSIERYTKSLKKLAEGIGGIFEDIYKNIILDIYKWVVEKGLPQLIDVFTKFNNEVDWESLRKHLNNVWEAISQFAKSVGQGLIDFIGELANGIKDLLNSKWFLGFLDGIASLLKSIKPSFVTTFLNFWLGFKIGKNILFKLLPKFITFYKFLNKTSDALVKLSGRVSSVSGKLMTLLTSSAGFVGTVYVSAIVELATLYHEISSAMSNAEKLLNKNNALPKSYQEYLDKIDSANDSIIEQNTELDNSNAKIINLKDDIDTYKKALDDCVDANGNIKKGYEEQAKFLVGQINDALGTNYDIIGNQVQGYKKMNSQLERQIALVTKKKLLEKNAEKYITAKKGVSEKGEEHYNLSTRYKAEYKEYKKWKKLESDYRNALDKKDYKNERERQILQQNWVEAKSKKASYKGSSDRLKKSLGKNEKVYYDYVQSILRQEALLNAKTKEEEEKAIARFSGGLSKKEKTALSSIEKIANLTGESIEDVTKKYTKNGNIQYDKLADGLKKAQDKVGKAKIKAPKVDKASFEKANKTINDTIGGLYSGRKIRDALAKNKINPAQAIDLSKGMQTAYKNGKKISDKLAEGVESGNIDPDTAISYVKTINNAKLKGKDISKYLGENIFKNKQSVQNAIDKLKEIIDNGVPKEKTTKYKTEKGKNFDSVLGKIASAISKIPSTKEIEIKAKLDISNFKTISKATNKISKMVEDGWKVTGTGISGGHKFAILKKGNKTKHVRTMASGGFVNMGTEFIAGEKGAEMVGTINGKTGVASNMEITGIREEVANQGQMQNELLQKQNQLLVQLLEKNTDIVLDGEKVTKRVNKINARSGYRMAT